MDKKMDAKIKKAKPPTKRFEIDLEAIRNSAPLGQATKYVKAAILQQQQLLQQEANSTPSPPPLDTITTPSAPTPPPTTTPVTPPPTAEYAKLASDIQILQDQLASIQQQLAQLLSAQAALASPPPPAPASNTNEKASPSTTANTNTSETWATVTKRARKPLTEKKLNALARVFSVPPTRDATTTGFEYIYLNRSRKTNRREIRHRFSSLGVDSSRIVDITFPSRNVTGILIHKEFKPTFLDFLKPARIQPLPDFDPLDPHHLIDPAYTNLPLDHRAKLAKAINQDRCMRTLQYTRDYLVPSIAKFFVSVNYLPQTLADNIVQSRSLKTQLTPRTKMDPTSATALFLTNHGLAHLVTSDTEMQEAVPSKPNASASDIDSNKPSQ